VQFLDTNVLIYAHDRSVGNKHLRAKELTQEPWQSAEGCLGIQALQEFYVNVTRQVAKSMALDRPVVLH
jgi:predicted nucleic acid-binding protein